MLILLLLATAVLAVPDSAPALATPAEPQVSRWAASVAVLAEQSSLPSTTPVRAPLHPGAAVSLVWYARHHTRHLFNLDPGISWFYHHPLYSSFTAAVSAGYRYQSSFRLGIEGRLGLGYIHSFATRPQYALEDGRVREVTDWGRGALWAFAEIKLTCVVSPRASLWPVLAYLSYGPSIETPFSPDNGVWVLPRTIAKVGMEFAVPSLRRGP